MKHQNKYLEKIQAEINLHGFTKDEASVALSNFLKDAESKEYKKVRIITGKGLHSESGRGVLSEYIKKILESKGLKYSDAKIYEGGEGAIDVDLN